MHPFKSIWERLLRDGDSGGNNSGNADGPNDPGVDPMGGNQGVGAGGTNAPDAGAGNTGDTGGQASGTSTGSPASENVGVEEASAVSTAPSAAPGTTATSNVGTTTASTEDQSVVSQEENATMSTQSTNSKQGFSNVATDAMTEQQAIALGAVPGTTPSMSNSVAAVGQVNVDPATNTMSVTATTTEEAVNALAEQLGVTPGTVQGVLDGKSPNLSGHVSMAIGIGPEAISGVSVSVSAKSDTTDIGSTSGTQGGQVSASGTGTTDANQSATTSDAGQQTSTAESQQGGQTATGDTSSTDTASQAGTTGNAGSTSPTGATGEQGAFGGTDTGEASPGATTGTPTSRSFSQVASPQSQQTGVTSLSDVLGAIAGAVNPIGSAQAQTIDPNTGGIGGGQGQQGTTEEEEQEKAKKGKAFGGVAPAPGVVDVMPGIMNTLRGFLGGAQTPSSVGIKGGNAAADAIDAAVAEGLAQSRARAATMPAPPPLPTLDQVNAPALPGMTGFRGVDGEEGGVPGATKGTTKGFAGVAPAQPPAPAMPPRNGPAPAADTTAPTAPRGSPMGPVGVSKERSDAIKSEIEALVSPQTVEQIMNNPPVKSYPALPPSKLPGILDRMGKGQPGVMSQSGDGTGGPSTPGAKGQAPGVQGQTVKGEEEPTPVSVVPKLPSFGGVAQAPTETPPSMVPALPQLPSITTTQQPTQETMPAATIDKNAPQSFTSALAAANKTMTVKEGMQAIGALRGQAVATLGNPNATQEDVEAAKSYLDKTNSIANPGAMNVTGVSPSVQANQQKQGTAAAIAGNPSIGMIDKAFTGAMVNPVSLSTQTNIAASVAKVGSMSGIPGISTMASLGSRAAAKWGGSTQGATLGQEEAAPNTPGATTPWGGDDGFGDTRGDNSGFGRIAGLSSGARLADMGLGGVNSFATIGSDPLFVAQDYGLAGDAFSTLGYSLPGEVDDPRIPEAGRRVTNGFLLRRVA